MGNQVILFNYLQYQRSLCSVLMNSAHHDKSLKPFSHEERLKYCKKVFDQLHRSNFHTFAITHNSSSFTISSQAQSTSNFQENQRIHHKLKDSITQIKSKSEPKSFLNSDSKSIEKGKAEINIIKKMLEISKNKKSENDDYKLININEKDGRNKSVGVFDINSNFSQVGFPSQKEKLLHFQQGNSKVSDFSLNKQKKQSNKAIIKSSKGEKQPFDTKQQQNRQSRLSKYLRRPSPKSRSLQKETKNNKAKSSFSPAPTTSTIPNVTISTFQLLSLKDYIKFIVAPPEITQIHIQFNFNPIRKLTPNEAWSQLDVKNTKLIQSLIRTISKVFILK